MNYSNLAYELDRRNDTEEHIEKKKAHKKIEKRNFKPIVYAVVLCMAAYYMISKNVAVYETEQEIK